MGVIIILIIAGVYILAYLRAFLFTRLTRSSNEISIPRYELLRFYSKVFRIVSLGVLAIVLGVHAVVYFGSFWAEQMFGFLLWIQPDPDSEDDSYLMQVGVIIFWTLLPYAKYSFGIVKTFKKQLFKYLQEKYKTNFEIIDSKLFFKKLQKTNIAHYALTDNNFRKLVIKNKSDANRRYGSDVSLDDVLYFPDKRMYITECDVQGYQEIYTQDNDGDWHWEKVIQKRSAFSGFIIIIDKDLSNDHIYQKLKEDTNLSNGAVNFYKVNNNKVLVKSKRGRSKKKHGSILNFYFNYFEDKASPLLKDSLKQLSALNKLDNYKNVNKSLSEIAEILNIDYVMEDTSRIYLFHKERPIDFFTFYQDQKVKISIETFEDDFKLLLEISKRF